MPNTVVASEVPVGPDLSDWDEVRRLRARLEELDEGIRRIRQFALSLAEPLRLT